MPRVRIFGYYSWTSGKVSDGPTIQIFNPEIRQCPDFWKTWWIGSIYFIIEIIILRAAIVSSNNSKYDGFTEILNPPDLAMFFRGVLKASLNT